METVLFLYIKDQSEEAEKLKDYLQTSTQLGKRVNCISILDVVAEGSQLSVALNMERKCVVLVSSAKAARMIEEGEKEMDEGFTIFDGQLIRDFYIGNEQQLQKLLLVCLGEDLGNQSIPQGLDRCRVFTIAGDIQAENPTVCLIMDAIKTLVI